MCTWNAWKACQVVVEGKHDLQHNMGMLGQVDGGSASGCGSVVCCGRTRWDLCATLVVT